LSDTVNVRIEGLDELYAQLNRLAKQVESAKTEPVLKEGADIMTSEAKGRAPVKTGRLRDNIVTLQMARLGENPRSAMTKVKQARWEAPHGHLVEFGTKFAAAHPFFRPAWDMTRGRIYSGVVARLKALIEAVAK